MIDLHCHLLPGMDDGPADTEAAVAQARRHVDAGVTCVVCTPHVNQSYGNTASSIDEATGKLQQQLRDEGIDLELVAGAEVSLSRALDLSDDELTGLHLGQSDWLLLEPPLGADVPRLAQTALSLQARGHRLLIAHPERCAAFHHAPGLLAELVGGGALAQVTATSLTGQFGRTVEKLARKMVRDGLIHVVSSDAHDADRRAPGLLGPLEQAGLGAIASQACDAIPSALLLDADLPPAGVLTPAPRRGWLRRG